MAFQKIQTDRDKIQISGWPGWVVGEGLTQQAQGNCGVLEMLPALTVVVVTHYMQNSQNLPLSRVEFTVCDVHLNKIEQMHPESAPQASAAAGAALCKPPAALAQPTRHSALLHFSLLL